MSYTINSSIRAKYYLKAVRKRSVIKYVVMHYTANSGTSATAKGNANYFKNADRQASAHYVVRAGEPIYYCVPIEYPAYAVGGSKYANTKGAYYYGKCKNSNSVSIEMVSCTDPKGNYYIPEGTQELAAELAANLLKELGLPMSALIRHYDVNGKPCPEPMSVSLDGKTSHGDEWAKFQARVQKYFNKTSTNTQSVTAGNSYKVKITTNLLNVRKEASATSAVTTRVHKGEVYTIIDEKMNGVTKWLRLKSGTGWISAKFAQKI